MFWLFEQYGGTVGQNIVLVSQQNIVSEQREVTSMDTIYYFEYVRRPLSAKFAVKGALLIAELLARAQRARGRSPIAKVIYPSQKIW